VIVRGELTAADAYRLHQLHKPVVVLIRSASASASGLKRLMSCALLMRRHQYVFVLRRTLMRDKKIAHTLNRVRRMKNVFFGVIEDEDNPKNIQQRRLRLYDRLVRDARCAASELAV